MFITKKDFITKEDYEADSKKRDKATNDLLNRLREDLLNLENYLGVEKRKRAVLKSKYYWGVEIGEEAVVEEYYAKKEEKRKKVGRPKGSKNKR